MFTAADYLSLQVFPYLVSHIKTDLEMSRVILVIFDTVTTALLSLCLSFYTSLPLTQELYSM